MLTLIVTSWLTAAAAFPLNPTEQDTLDYMNLHLTAGMSGPNHLVSSGLEISAKFETLIHHPFVLRAAVDYKYGNMTSKAYPKGSIHGTTYSLDCFYYRGTDHLTGYVGLGALFSKSYPVPSQSVADSLLVNENVTDVSMSSQVGYRVTLGLRFDQNFSVEIGLTDVRPKLLTTKSFSANRSSVYQEQLHLQEVRVSVGYLVTIAL